MTRRFVQLIALFCGLVLLAPASAAAAQSYVVQPGDTLWGIASRFGVSVDHLISANHLANPDALTLGQRLVIPAGAPARRVPAASPARSSSQFHVVQNGDTLWSIASRYGVGVDALVAANRLPNPDSLKLGQRLIVPGRSAPPSSQRAAARPPAAATSSFVLHTVTPGDTLWTIASRYRTSVNALISANVLRNPDSLTLGQRLKVPVASAPKPAAPETAAKPLPKPVAKPAPQPAVAAQPVPAARTSVRPVPPLRALPGTAVAPARLLPRSAIPSRGEKWASTMQQVALRVLGVRYRWGGISPRGFDCSGFINYVMSHVGVRVPRTTFAMFATGRPVSRSQLQVGDVVFFQTVSRGPSHAGIYIGNNLFMHSSSGIGRVSITSLDYRYYKARFYGARRF